VKAKVEMVYEAKTEEHARAIAGAIKPENEVAPSNMKITTSVERTDIVITLKFNGKMESLIYTLDDLLEHMEMAENVLGVEDED